MQSTIYLIGVGGAGMSGIAHLLHELGYMNIVGIDKYASQITDKLISRGIKIHISDGCILPQSGDIVIYSEATRNTPEVKKAYEYYTNGDKHALPPMSYFQYIGEISKLFTTLAIAGTNGKSTTTAMSIVAAKNIPDIGIGIVGSMVPQLNGTNIYLNQTHRHEIKQLFDRIMFGDFHVDYSLIKKIGFIIEACEFNKHFLLLDVDYALINDVVLDHTDIYETQSDFEAAFQQFANNVRHTVICFENDQHLFGKKKKSDQLKVIQSNQRKQIQPAFMIGDHNKKNAYGAYTLLSYFCDITNNTHLIDTIKHDIEQFEGLRRRAEYITTTEGGATIYSDYAHHPEALKKTLTAFKQYFPNQTLHCIFQPHQAQRVIEFWNEFRACRIIADAMIIYNIYTARENITQLIAQSKKQFLHDQHIETIDQLGELFAHPNAEYTNKIEDIFDYINQCGPDDIVLICTAGDLDYTVRQYLKSNNSNK